MMISLKTRLFLGLMFSLIVIFTLQWMVVTYVIGRLTENQLVDRLQRESENLLASIHYDADGFLQVDSQRMGSVYHYPFSGHYFIVLSGYQQQVSRSLWDHNFTVKPMLPAQQTHFRIAGPERQPLLVLVHGYSKQQHTVTIAVAEDMTALQSGINRFNKLYALVSVLGLVFLLLAQRLIVLGALKPLRNIQESIAKLGQGESDHVEVLGPEEIRPLIEEFNRLLTGMDRKSKRSREALGNLAHALKTRLTLLNQIAERPELNEVQDLRSSIYASTEVIGNIIERELKRARLLGNLHPGHYVDLKAEVAELVLTLRQIHVAKGISISWEVASEARFVGDQEDLIEMLGNLLDNACKWCHQRVSLTVVGNDSVSFIVEDDGLGALATELDALVRRGFRADETKPGSGLGLAIVNDIVESYGGYLIFGRSVALGGLRVEAKFYQTKVKPSS